MSKQAHATKKGPGRRPVTKADIRVICSIKQDYGAYANVSLVRTVSGSWLPSAKIRKQAKAGTISLKNKV